MATRYDNSSALRSPEKLSSGFMRVDGYLTRVGIFEYRDGNGGVRREFRPEEEVMDAASLASFRLMPMTNDHPPGLLNAGNAKQYSVGSVGETVRKDGEHVAASMLITDAAAVADVEGGKGQLSCGYSCDYDATPGNHPKYGRYDGTQRNIRGNHVAIVDRGRAGDARLRLDSDDAAMVEVVHTDTGEKLMKITIKGVEVDVPDTAAQLLIAERNDSAAALALVTKRADQEQARADAAVEAKTAADKARTDALDPVKFTARVNSRVALLLGAVSVLGTNVKLDAASDRDVMGKVLAKLAPEVKLDEKSEAYVTARFDIAMEAHDKANPGLNKARGAAEQIDPSGKPTLDAADVDTEEQARTRMIEANKAAALPKK